MRTALRNALEGFGIGMAAATVFRVFRFVKGMRRAGEGGGDDAGGAAQRYLDENRAELEDIADDLEVLQADPNFLRNAVSSPVGSAASRAVSTDSPEALARAGADADDAAVATLRARAVTPEAPTPAAFDPVRPVVDTDAVEAGLIRLDADPNYVDEFVPSPLNHARMDTPEEVQQGVRAIGEAVRPQIEALVGTGTQTFDSLRVAAAERLADATGLGLDTIVASARRAAASAQEQAEILIASEQAMLSVTREARKVSRLVVEGRATDVDRARLQLLAQQSGDLLASHKAIGTGAARTTSAGRISAADTLDTVQLNNAYVRDAISRGDVDILAEQIHSMAGKVGAITRVLNKPPSLLRKFTEFYVNARLSNPATHLLNFVSTATHTIALPMEQIIGGGVRFLGGGGASAARDMREGLLEFWYMKESMQEGWQSIGQSFRTSQSVLDTNTKLDEVYSKIAITSDSQSVWGSGMRGFGNLVRIPTRLLTTGDEIFKQVAYRANLKARSHIEAGELFGGDVVARNDYVQRKLAEGFDPNTGRALDADALQRAREATFTTPLDEGRAFVDIARALQGAVRVAPPLRFVAPFIRTPANLIRQAIMRTPALGLLHKEMLADIAAGGVRRSRAIGKQTMGLSVVAGTLFAVQNGRFTGSGPSDPRPTCRLNASWLETPLLRLHR